jgi:hypothetical protein
LILLAVAILKIHVAFNTSFTCVCSASKTRIILPLNQIFKPRICYTYYLRKKIYIMRTNHEIDYKIYGEELQFVEIELDPNETAIAESGAFMMMDNGIEMQTIFGDGSQQQQSGGILGQAA